MGESMKLLVINGSPKGKRSNTYRLTQAFTEGICRIAPDTQIREAEVSKLEIKPCLGCFACWNKTPGKCCLSDDMSRVLEDMLWADVVIWSFPLYYFSVPGPLKNLMDRQLPLVLPFMSRDAESGGHPSRYDMSGKRHVVLSTCGFHTAKGNYEGVNAIFDHICGKGHYTSLYCGQGELFRVKELSARTDAYLNVVRNAGEEFISGSISPATWKALEEPLYPRAVFEAMADASWGVEKSGAPSDESLTFTRQMAALYNKSAYSGKELVLEMYYTDLERRYQILLGKDGSTVLTEDFQTPTTTIETTFDLWKAIAAGEISGQDALMQQKYRVRGNFDLMIRWDKYFGSEVSVSQTAQNHKPTNMAMLLLPWIVFWITTGSMDSVTAARLSILISVLTPVIFFRCRTIFFDHISALAVTLCGILLLTDVALTVVLPLSYFLFGLLWTVTGFLKIPLTAHYSLNDYGGEGMLSNPLFLKTNRILTLCWGILYLLMTLWTVVLMGFGCHWIGTVNSLLPMGMSFFTVWFQKWYPAKVARGD